MLTKYHIIICRNPPTSLTSDLVTSQMLKQEEPRDNDWIPSADANSKHNERNFLRQCRLDPIR